MIQIVLRHNHNRSLLQWCYMSINMMTSSNGTIFRVTGPLCEEFTGHGEFPAQRQWRGALIFSLICARIIAWVNDREAGRFETPARPLWRHCNDGVSNHLQLELCNSLFRLRTTIKPQLYITSVVHNADGIDWDDGMWMICSLDYVAKP